MRKIILEIDKKSQAYAAHPLFERLADRSLSGRERLSFAPALSHFVMSFADVYGLVLRDEKSPDLFQEIVNAHTYEDGDHWRWFLHDLKKLGMDDAQPLTKALSYLWSEATHKTRMLTYRMCRLGLGASSIEKLVLVSCIEAAGKVSLTAAAPAAAAFTQETGEKLVYLGSHHVETESHHSLEQPEIMDEVLRTELTAEQRKQLLVIVDEAFAAFEEFATDLLQFSTSRQRAA